MYALGSFSTLLQLNLIMPNEQKREAIEVDKVICEPASTFIVVHTMDIYRHG